MQAQEQQRRAGVFQVGLFIAVWLLVMVVGRNVFFRDPGALWHVVVGERLLTTGEFITADPFSFTAAGEPWIAQQWLGEVILALLHRLGEFDTLLLAGATFLAALYTWVGHRLLRAGLHPGLVVALVAWAMAGSCYHFHSRPHLVTIALVGWTYARLCDYESGRISIWQLFWLVPVFVIWTNIHGGMLGGLAMVSFAVAGWALSWGLGRKSPLAHSWHLLVLILLVLACGLTPLLNPYGLDLPRVWVELATSPVLPQVILEHRPLWRSGLIAGLVAFIGFLYLAALAGTWPRWPHITWLIPLLWLILAVTRVRHGPLFTITAVLALGELLPQARWVRWLADKGSALMRIRARDAAASRSRFPARAALFPAGLVLACLTFQMAQVPVPLVGRGWAGHALATSPVDLLPDLRRLEGEGVPDRGVPIFNDMGYGGFLIYYTPGFRVFIDDRCELYGDERLLRFARACWKEPEQIDRWAHTYGFRVALVPNDSLFARHLDRSREWAVVRRGATATLFQIRACQPPTTRKPASRPAEGR